MAKLVGLTKETRLKYLHKYFVNAFNWQVYKVEGIGESKARVRNILTGKAEYMDTDTFLIHFGGCNYYEVDWKPETHVLYFCVDPVKGTKHKFQLHVFQPGSHALDTPLVNVTNTYRSLKSCWEAIEVYAKQFPDAEIWFTHISETTMKVRGRWKNES